MRHSSTGLAFFFLFLKKRNKATLQALAPMRSRWVSSNNEIYLHVLPELPDTPAYILASDLLTPGLKSCVKYWEKGIWKGWVWTENKKCMAEEDIGCKQKDFREMGEEESCFQLFSRRHLITDLKEKQDESGAGSDLVSLNSHDFTGVCFMSVMCLMIF